MTSNDNQATKIVKGIKNSNPIQRNSIESLLNRSIKFRKSRHVDQKLELFKQKFVPVNETTGVVFASTGSSYSTAEEDSIASKIDEHGFESPSKMLYSPDKLNFSWLSILPIGPGLKDLGQLSSLNAVLQVITYTPVLANYFLQRRHSANCTMQEYCFACAVEEHVRTALNGTTYALQPRVFVGKLKQIKNGSTKDAYDVWKYFMNQIQSSLLAEKGSKDELIQQTTALCQTFGGYIQNAFECLSCNKMENKYDFFMDLSLDLLQCSSLERCMTKYFKEQAIATMECPNCQREVELKGKKSVYRSPRTLAIQLRRFNTNSGVKINKDIKFESSLDLSRVITNSEKDHIKSKYDLYAIIAHTGESLFNGHYVAYVKGPNSIWYCMDNEVVQQVSVNRLLSEKAYMLFYTIPPEPVKREKRLPVTNTIKDIPVEGLKEEEPKEPTVQEEEELVTFKEEDNEEEEKQVEYERLKAALEEASKKEKVENQSAIVVSHNERMKSKRDKLEALIEKESVVSKSLEVKSVLLSKHTDSQFQDDINTWDEDIGTSVEDQRKSVLKQIKSKRKKVDAYDLEYDRGKVKKVKKKQDDKFHKPNMFQITADKKLNKKKGK
ncbi:cysteine proteinase [Rhizopus microsporus var. microsporus]|uniref:ubiquitinyl hydrolase 1 n=2 Tax=Rhizopus microsporus TaxID=58291 RepID=A0A2G4SMW7_RHIZD|nr:cysteine proteinase [Rhizopus microsporus ATCC 52813]ORE08219.1 cysteine proteinase [Rhizopus microsporus var. microsporus]PHZ09716.1 cysteine proteinase [Rhizopus microsporus ATCC 52813]